MISTALRRTAAVTAAAALAGALTVTVADTATGSSQPQHRQVATASLSNFKVVLRLTRGSGSPPMATLTATGYRRSGNHWKAMATKRIGKPNEWFWFALDTCSLTVRQSGGLDPVRTDDSMKVTLLVTPTLGCVSTQSKTWHP
jgi:hypothetical protein